LSSEKRSIPIMKPCLGEDEAQAARRAILSGWVTQGPEVAAFEQEFRAYVGADHACAVSNCTTALHLALVALGVGRGDEVITVSHSFIATANSVRFCGATPVFADIDPLTFNIDAARVEPLITERTKAILCVHQIGMPCDIAAVLEIAGRRGLRVVEDAACAIGSEIRIDGRWERIGRPHGDIACFSFHPRKTLTTGDGGMLTTSSTAIDAHLRLLRHQGMSVPDTVRHGALRVIDESYPIVGYNYRMTDIQAAVGRVQLARLPELIARRREQADRYCELLDSIDGVSAPHEPAYARSSWQSYCVRLEDGIDRHLVMQAMLDRGVSTRRGILCAHREPAYPPETWRAAPGPDALAESERARDQCVLLPIYHDLAPDEQEYVVETLRTAIHATARVVG